MQVRGHLQIFGGRPLIGQGREQSCGQTGDVPVVEQVPGGTG
jgi:hypothetical protein